MHAGNSRQAYRVRSEIPRICREVAAPRWLLKLHLQWVDADIARLEAQLDDEFGLLETAPIHHDLAAMVGVREGLERRLMSLA